MNRVGSIGLKWVITSLFVCGAVADAKAGDLSKYRSFQLGADLPAVALQIGATVAQAKVVHSRPALIQELEWRPQPPRASTRTDSANEIVFTFFNGELYRIEVKYDRYEIEGLTTEDIVEAVSVIYGPAAPLTAAVDAARHSYGDRDEVVAQWQDPQHRFDLVRSSYAGGFRLVGVLKRLDSPAQTAMQEAKVLDDLEAPQRAAARAASEQDAAKESLEKARVANKPRFKP